MNVAMILDIASRTKVTITAATIAIILEMIGF
jgi:hypothetical protein